jgi:hypothetical protein
MKRSEVFPHNYTRFKSKMLKQYSTRTKLKSGFPESRQFSPRTSGAPPRRVSAVGLLLTLPAAGSEGCALSIDNLISRATRGTSSPTCPPPRLARLLNLLAPLEDQYATDVLVLRLTGVQVAEFVLLHQELVVAPPFSLSVRPPRQP